MDATVRVDPAVRHGAVSPLIYGQYVEHVADCVYPSMWDDTSPLSDERGLRRDVMAAARELGVPVVRWPGGCFADTYHWQDGIGPGERRPMRRNWHWGGLEPNRMGTDEFLYWCERTGAQPYLNVNVGTGTMHEMLRWLDYCTGTDETEDVLRRHANGRVESYEVPLCGIGNEPWGSWEAGTMPVAEYARTLADWADFAKRYAPGTRIVGAGSEEARDPEWDRTVLGAAGPYLDFLSCHSYSYSIDRSTGREFLAAVLTAGYLESRLRAMVELAAGYRPSRVAASPKRPAAAASGPVRIALDEWNIRHYEPDGSGGYRHNRASPRTVQDVVFAAGVFHAMLRLSPAVGMANHVFLVNGNAILNVYGERLVRTTLFHLFRQYRRWMVGEVADVAVECPTVPTPRPQAGHPGWEPHPDWPPRSALLDAAATVDGEGTVTVALVNRNPDEPAVVQLRMPEPALPRTAWTLTHEDVYAVNDLTDPDRVVPTVADVPDGTTEWTCPPHSVTLLRG